MSVTISQLNNGLQIVTDTMPGVETVEVELVFDPPWSREMMSEEAQLELGMV